MYPIEHKSSFVRIFKLSYICGRSVEGVEERSEMNEKIYHRHDRKRYFDHRITCNNMDYCKLDKRDHSQCERLFLRIMESVHNALSVKGDKKC